MPLAVGGKCRVCTHEAVETIDAALVAGSDTYGVIAAEHGLSDQAVARHCRKHLSRRVARGLVPSATQFSNDVVAHVKRHLSRTHQLSMRLEAKGDERGAVAAMREYRHGAALLARVLGDLPPDPASITINNFVGSVEYRNVIAVIRNVLDAEGQPALGRKIAAALVTSASAPTAANGAAHAG